MTQSCPQSWPLSTCGWNSTLCTWTCPELPPMCMSGLPNKPLETEMWLLQICAPPESCTVVWRWLCAQGASFANSRVQHISWTLQFIWFPNMSFFWWHRDTDKICSQLVVSFANLTSIPPLTALCSCFSNHFKSCQLIKKRPDVPGGNMVWFEEHIRAKDAGLAYNCHHPSCQLRGLGASPWAQTWITLQNKGEGRASQPSLHVAHVVVLWALLVTHCFPCSLVVGWTDTRDYSDLTEFTESWFVVSQTPATGVCSNRGHGEEGEWLITLIPALVWVSSGRVVETNQRESGRRCHELSSSQGHQCHWFISSSAAHNTSLTD